MYYSSSPLRRPPLLSDQISDALRLYKIILNCPSQESPPLLYKTSFSLQKRWPYKRETAVHLYM